MTEIPLSFRLSIHFIFILSLSAPPRASSVITESSVNHPTFSQFASLTPATAPPPPLLLASFSYSLLQVCFHFTFFCQLLS